MTTSKAKDQEPKDPAGPDQPPLEEEAPPASGERYVSPEELSPDDRASLARAYHALRTAQAPGDAEEARERIRKIQGPDAEIGDHVVTLANGWQGRMEYAGATRHNGVPVLAVYEDPL